MFNDFIDFKNVKLGFARTSDGRIRGVDLQSGEPILLCCGKSIYKDVSGDEKVTGVVDAEDLCELIKVGDYVNGHKVCDVNIQGRIIYCEDFHYEYTPEQVLDIVSEEDFNRDKFVIQRALDRAKQLDERNEE